MGWLDELGASGQKGKEAWQVQLWLGIFPIHRRQLGNPALLHNTVGTIRSHLGSTYGQMLQSMLLDPALSEQPILRIAYDLGYQTLAPFNLAFKQLVGQTPSVYRKSGLDPHKSE